MENRCRPEGKEAVFEIPEGKVELCESCKVAHQPRLDQASNDDLQNRFWKHGG
jgi:hypothetical protein